MDNWGTNERRKEKGRVRGIGKKEGGISTELGQSGLSRTGGMI